MQVFAVHGANTLAVFDPDPSTPAAVSCPGEGCGDCTANFGKGTCSVSIRTSTLDFVIDSTAINGAPACGPHYQTGQVQGFTSLMPNQNGRCEVDYAITSLPQTTVVFGCNGTDESVILVDAISAHVAFDGYPEKDSHRGCARRHRVEGCPCNTEQEQHGENCRNLDLAISLQQRADVRDCILI